MIVTCRNCETSFQLDDSRVPAQGIRVRCSRCKESFFLEHPGASRSEALEAVAGQALSGRARRTPDATQDLPQASELRRTASSSRSGQATKAASEEVDNEDEWVFNRDVPGEDDSEEDLAGDADAFERVASAAGSGQSLDAGYDAVASDEEGPDESVFGSVDDFSSLVGDDAPPEAELDDSLRAAPVAGTAVGATRASEPVATAGDESGDPESWDFFGDESLERVPRRSAERSPSGRVGAVSRSDVNEVAPGFGDFDEADYAEGEEASAVAVWTAHLARAAGWALTVLLATMGLVTGLSYSSQRLVGSQAALDVSPLRADSVRAAWLETARAGRLLVVTGELRNASAQPAAPGRMLEVVLLDAAGQSLVAPSAPVGLALSESDMRELAPGALLAARASAARALAGTVVAPGGSVTVQTLFSALPEAAARFILKPSDRLLEALAAEPGVEAVEEDGAATAAEGDPAIDPLLDL